MAWFISDNHFNHTKIIEYCNRPFTSVEEMNKYMIDQWNDVVSKDDLVYHLGDFALCSDEEDITNLVQQLNGNIVLILGNHDRWGRQKFLNCGFVGSHKKLEISDYILTHRPVDDLEDGKINIHGHIHNYDKGLDKERYINVSCEVINYRPMWVELNV